MAQETATPKETLVAATQQNTLPPDRIVLLGTVIKPDEAAALIRLNRGRPRKVTIGDRIGNATVVAIENGTMHLARNRRVSRLEVPGK